MAKDPEKPNSGESKNQEVFDIFDRASSQRRNTALCYFIGDGIVVKIGWVDNGKETPDLTLELRDEKFGKDAGLTVGPETARYVREGGSLPLDEWLAADMETRRHARQFHRSEAFSISTASLAPIAQAVSQHEPHTEPDPSDSETMYEASLTVEPLPSTDIPFIRQLIDAWSQPLDGSSQL
jgi:hypothetical protein